MTSVLRCMAGPYQGRELPLRAETPLNLPIRSRSGEEGRVVIAAAGGGWQLRNESVARVLVNGEGVEAAVLGDGDNLQIGSMSFCVALDPGCNAATEQLLSGDTVMLRVPPAEPGQRHPMLPDQEDEDITRTAIPLLDAPPPELCTSRRRRKISASRISGVEASRGPTNLLGKMTQALRRPRLQSAAQLEIERQHLLLAAGRLALEQQGGFGLPPELLRRLSLGETISLSIDDLQRSQLDVFRRRRQRLQQLDSELAALSEASGDLTRRRLSDPALAALPEAVSAQRGSDPDAPAPRS